MLKIVICDDENLFLNEYKVIIEKICTERLIECTIDTLNSGYSAIDNYNKYDLIFLDIDMPYLDGIATAEQINKLKGNLDIPYIIFVTSKDNLVFDALKQFPYSFIKKNHFNEDIENCILSINNKLADKAIKYPIKTGRNTIFLNPDNIMYIEKDKNYVVFHTKYDEYKERSNIDEKLKDLESNNFIRTHVGYLVNLTYIEEITNTEVTLLDGTKIPVSKSYKQSVKDIYFDWMVKRR